MGNQTKLGVRDIERQMRGEMIFLIRKVDRMNVAPLYVALRLEGTREHVLGHEETLVAARQLAGIAYRPPVKETRAKGDYSQYTGNSH